MYNDIHAAAIALASTTGVVNPVSGNQILDHTALLLALQPGGINNGRYFTAYLTFAGLFCGLGLHELASSLAFILAKRAAWHTPLLKIAVVTWACILAYLAMYITFVDLRISPFVVDMDWYRRRFVALMIASCLSSFGLYSLLLIRTSMFFKTRSITFIALSALCALTMLTAFTFSVCASYLALTVLPSSIAGGDILQDKTVSMLAAISHITQGIFSSLCSFMFLFSIAKAVGMSSSAFVNEVFVNHDGARFVIIILLCVFTAGCQVYNALRGPNNYIVYLSYYVDAWLFPLEMFTFLSTSYMSAKELIGKSAVTAGMSRPHTTENSDSGIVSHLARKAAKSNAGDSAIGSPVLVYGGNTFGGMHYNNTVLPTSDHRVGVIRSPSATCMMDNGLATTDIELSYQNIHEPGMSHYSPSDFAYSPASKDNVTYTSRYDDVYAETTTNIDRRRHFQERVGSDSLSSIPQQPLSGDTRNNTGIPQEWF
ncbi:hypothetical protein BASA50_010069 [Batrachochytrium salamandrivorans]|uniref:Uncharacterized protein n=1 Tax=Batrachochytrium salamandrivorans TaxID=1357716 RepID=A0ABQ8EZN1_9FUNG|nr:hypothetical protein BASA62_002603 [Batrachochytrium salamandrivorans]KAH6580851.1 hypothetical protein BASA60_002718 [Batrachochytrium salamandrivorans]KAH6584152.1 hypothetical protein BASA61_007651 [Batrachochytrium salamandrivorans]KAH6589415.1 hypothetical protein BASA50_010069 [Batrachochytrium salamandrivorans]KAJ1328623.1 hypothetical protein BSLG_010355 [Batrachochytrium salamandrivorans]